MAGSPPRVRGTGLRKRLNPPHGRITPACAGNSILSRFPVCRCKDHPRVCGEQNEILNFLWFVLGSPPRVRGTGFPPGIPPGPYRITPACAGNSTFSDYGEDIDKDHPRVCGEQVNVRISRQRGIGSPPRVRGTVPELLLPLPCRGITPACAGNRGMCSAGNDFD